MTTTNCEQKQGGLRVVRKKHKRHMWIGGKRKKTRDIRTNQKKSQREMQRNAILHFAPNDS